MEKTDKVTRILMIYYRLTKGESINKKYFASECGINERSVDRDIEDIRVFLSEIYSIHELIFDRTSNTYYMTGCNKNELSGIELMALLKILISSRAFTKEEMTGLLGELCSLVSNYKKNELIESVRNEIDNYISPVHGKAILKLQWDLNKCIMNHKKIRMHYYKQDETKVERIVSPISVIFSEYYFYLIAFIEGKEYNYPAFFRVDRIHSFEVLDETYPSYIYEKYNVGYMKNCIQFMYAGDLINVQMKCKKGSLENVLDRFPNGKVIENLENYYIVEAKIFGDGFIKWILSQGDSVEVIKPKQLRKKIFENAFRIVKLYEEEGDVDNGQED